MGNGKNPKPVWVFPLSPSATRQERIDRSNLKKKKKKGERGRDETQQLLPPTDHFDRSFCRAFLTGVDHRSKPPAPAESIGATHSFGRAANRRRGRQQPHHRQSIGRPATGLHCPRRQQRSCSPLRAESSGTGRDACSSADCRRSRSAAPPPASYSSDRFQAAFS